MSSVRIRRWEWCLAILAIVPGLLTIRESLWIDELHSSWCCRGPWSQVAFRAAEGNQLPLFNWFLKAWLSVFGEHEIAIRFPSLVFWFATIFIVAKAARTMSEGCATPRSWSVVPLLIMGSWLLFDRIGAFYSNEARPYAAIALCSAVMTITSLKLGQPSQVPKSQHESIRADRIWIAAACFAIHLNPTAGFVVLASWLTRCVLAPREDHVIQEDEPLLASVRFAHIRARVVEAGAVGIACLPMIPFVLVLAKKRSLWASFASDSSMASISNLLPIVPWIAIPFFARLLTGMFPGVSKMTLNQRSMLGLGTILNRKEGMLLMIAMMPMVSVWFLTWTELAPLAHRRYVIGCYPSALLLGWSLFVRSANWRMSVLAGCCSLALMTFQQGTWDVWRSGQFIGWQRHENWKGAIAELERQAKEGEPVFVAPGLIETDSQQTMESTNSEYALFVVRGMYGSGALSFQLMSNQQALVDLARSPRRTWFLMRASPQRCSKLLEGLRKHDARNDDVVTEWWSYGNVQLVRVDMP